MAAEHTLLFTDIVGSTAVNSRLGDAAMAALWDAHDRLSRELLRRWHGREVDRSDGFLLLFERCTDAVAFSAGYHRMLKTLPVPLAARAGIHVGPLTLRETPSAEVALGAKPVEVVGIAKAIGARVMALAQAGQTLMSHSAHADLAAGDGLSAWQCASHGHWRLKGLEPMEVFEIGDGQSPFMTPPDSERGQRVALIDGQWVAVQEVPHSLPAEREPIVDRREVIQQLRQDFRDGARLITITGTGGMGKTRLALRYAWAWLGDHPGGVWFCDLSSARELDSILFAVGQGLDVPMGQDAVAQLGRAIAGRGRCLVVLDNFEQVRRHARDTLGRWLDAAPHARFIVTSREVLGLPGEHMLALSPLALEDGATLFHQRALAAHAGHDPQAHRLETQQLISLLDGMPLAIELAAPRVRVMSPPDLLARMGDRFRLLSSGDGRPDRQATLRATLAWSWDLLITHERAVLAQLSVFEGSFSWDAASDVIALPDDDSEAPWPLDLLQSLVDRSLVRPLAEGRFDLLRSVKDFAAEQLARDGSFPGSGPECARAVRDRHRRHFLQLSEAALSAATCPDVDNVVEACRTAVTDRLPVEAVTGLRLSWAALRVAGPFRAALALVEQVRQLEPLRPLQAAWVDWVEGHAQASMSDTDAAAKAALRGLQHLAQVDAAAPGLGTLCARLHLVMGTLLISKGQLEDSGRHLALAQAQAQDEDDAPLRCSILNVQGVLAYRNGSPDVARDHYQTALEHAVAHGDRSWQAALLSNLGVLHYTAGRLQQARQSFEEALTHARGSGDRRWEGDARCNLGMVHHDEGRLAEAEQELDQSLAIARALGHQRLLHTVICNLGLVAQARGKPDTARRHFETAIAAASETGDTRGVAEYQRLLAALQAADTAAAAGSTPASPC